MLTQHDRLFNECKGISLLALSVIIKYIVCSMIYNISTCILNIYLTETYRGNKRMLTFCEKLFFYAVVVLQTCVTLCR